MATILKNVMSFCKRALFKDKIGLYRIKFGIASGMFMCIGRRCNIRLELGLYELGVSRYFKQFAQKSKVAYDIGSYVGYYVLAMAKQGIEKIYAFDFDAWGIQELDKALKKNRITERVHFIKSRVSCDEKAGSVSIDRLINNGDILPPDFVKIDVDSEELDVLHSMSHTISLARPLFIVEVHSPRLEKECLVFLKNFGYSVKIVDNPFLLKALLPETDREHNRWIVASYGGTAANYG